MSERRLAERLSAEELSCLRFLATHPDAELSHSTMESADRMVRLGLVDKVLITAFPILPQRYRYRLTARGSAVLSAARRSGG